MDLATLARLDGMAQAELCARGDVSADELFDAALARIDALNPILRAAVTIARDRPQARERGPGPAPLRGVPFVVKDSTPWPGLRWSMGARLFARNIAGQQTPYGHRLTEAGLVCVGKSACSELGLLASTETLLEGATHNPWDLSISTGGSSGGSAAAVAAGLVPFAHANDGGGSLRMPASACGVFGFKPSRGRTLSASFGNSDFGDMTSDHVISRSVRDSALVLSIVEDAAARDPVGFVREPSPRRLRIASFTQTMNGGEPETEILRAHEEAILLLRELGHHVERIAAPVFDVERLADAFFLVAGAAVAAIIEGVDRTRGEPVQREELEPFTWALIDVFLVHRATAIADSRAVFSRAVQLYREATRDFDAVVTPTLAREAWPLGELSPVVEANELIRRIGAVNGYAPIHNIAGCPAMSVPLHVSTRGRPIGTQIAAAHGADALLLALAHELERARPWHDRWPPFSIPTLY